MNNVQLSGGGCDREKIADFASFLNINLALIVFDGQFWAVNRTECDIVIVIGDSAFEYSSWLGYRNI